VQYPLTCIDLGPDEERQLLALAGLQALKDTSEDQNMPLTCGNVELRGFEPRTSCMPSAGSTSTAVHLCRSPSQAVRISPPGSRPVAVLSCCTGQLGPSRYRWARDQLEPPRTLLRRFPGKQASPPQSPAPRPAHSKAVRGSAQTTGPRRRGITAGAARFQAPDGCIHGGGWRRATLRLSGHGS
jgi:hypothetical protein